MPRTPPPPPPCAWVQLRWAGASPPALAALSAVRTPGTGGVGLSWGQGQSLTRSGRRSGRGLSPWKRPPPQGYSDLRPRPRARRALRPPTVEFGALLTQRAAGHLAAPSCCPVRGDPLASGGDCSLVYSNQGALQGQELAFRVYAAAVSCGYLRCRRSWCVRPWRKPRRLAQSLAFC